MTKRVPRVIYWNNIPSPYMVDRFNALEDRGSFEFEVWFNDRSHADRSWEVDEKEWRFCYRYIPFFRLGGRPIHWPRPVFGRRPDFLVCGYSEPVWIIGWLVARLRRVRTGFRVLTTYDRWVARHRVKEALKRFLFRRVDAIETPGEDGKRFAMRYGTPAEQIYFATHTVNLPFLQGRAEQARQERDRLRQELGLEGATFIYVGRLWWGKGLRDLLNAFEVVQQESADPVSLLLVGDGPEEEELRRWCAERGVRNVVFAGFQQRIDLPRYYALADVFVFPTLGDPYGLVVDEAMACSLPVISTSAAGEITDRVEEGVNGYIVPPNDSNALASRMRAFVGNTELRARMGEVSEKKVQGHTPEQWAEDFERIVSGVLETKSR